MRVARLLLPFVVSVLFLISSAAQQTPPPLTPSPQRDAQAISILQQSLAAMGADRLPQVADLTISGQIVQQRALDKTSGTILLKMTGPEMVRVETNVPDGTTVHIVNGIRMRRIHGAEDEAMPMHAALNHPFQYVPLLSGLRTITDPSIAVSFVGEETVDGKSVYHVRVEKVYPQQPAEQGRLLSKLTGTDLYIEEGTFLPVMRVQELPSLIDAKNSLSIEFRYSDYRQIQGVMIPYKIGVYVNNQESAEIRFTSLVLNSGVNPLEFEVQP